MNSIIETYSRVAAQYDEDKNTHSCWGISAEKALRSILLKVHYGVVVDVGCGTGRALAQLAESSNGHVQFIGVEPALNMRKRADELTRRYSNVRIVDGSFEELPLETASVDYLYSIHAFHWTTDLAGSVRELSRVLKPTGEMDLFFIGRNNGHEFIRKTTPIFLKYMGPTLLLESASMRKQLTRDAAIELFESGFDKRGLTVQETYETFYDTLEGHWSWWVRIEGHFVRIPHHKKTECDLEIRKAIGELAGDMGIPYTIHTLHVKVRRPVAEPAYSSAMDHEGGNAVHGQ